jgi:hypothetical protein
VTGDCFELRRRSDDLIYRFTRSTRADGQSGFKRSDRDLWIEYRPELGWIAWDVETDSLAGRPWHVQPGDQTPDGPPAGEWVSKKGDKSYVYDLVYVAP